MKTKKTKKCADGGSLAGIAGGLSMLTEAYNYKPSLNQQAPSLLNGAVSGAAAGASFGLPGLALGALVGLGTSAYKQNKDANTVVFGSPGAYAHGGPINTPINPPAESTSVALPVLRQIGLEAILQQEAANTQRMREGYKISPSFGQGTSSVSKSKDRFHEKAMGGDISLNNSAFQVQGNPNIQDSEAYNYQGQNLKLDHNEVVNTTQDFVYSNKIRNPLTNNTFAKDASSLERSKGKSEEKVKLYDDKISETTMNMTNKSLDGLRALHQIVGTSKTNKMAKGGPFNWNEPLAQLQRDPQLVQRFAPNYGDPRIKYYPPTLPTEAPAYIPDTPTTDQSAYLDSVYGVNNQTAQRQQAPQAMLDYLADPMFGGETFPTGSTQSKGITKDENPFTTGDYMQMLGSLGTTIPYLDGAEKEKAYTDNSTITKQSFDANPQLYQNNRNYQNAINNVDTGSGSLRRAIQNQLYATKLNQDNQVVEQYQNLNNQATTQYQDRVSNQQRYNNRQITYTNDINAQNRAQQDAGIATGFANLSDFGKALNSKEIDNRQLKLLKILYPDGFKSYQLQNG